MNKEINRKIIESWKNKEGNVSSVKDIEDWIAERMANTHIRITPTNINEGTFWFYDDINGEILNRKRSFFQIKGIQWFDNKKMLLEQPIIIQPEIGYLGIICREIDGVLNFLMQAKIEPGNVNGVQISPTLQATKSNFTKAHGGHLPDYFAFFEQASAEQIIVDQIQSEQGSRFYKKRNRNMIIYVNEDIDVLPNYKWMTLGQIKHFMNIDNLVNMDTRTVLSNIILQPTEEVLQCIERKELKNSLGTGNTRQELIRIYKHINDYKMFNNMEYAIVPLNHLRTWEITEYGVKPIQEANFEVGFYDIAIEGREVQNWSQPLFKARGSMTLGLITCVIGESLYFLVRARAEVGCCDKIEIGPSVQLESDHKIQLDRVEELFLRKINTGDSGIITDVILSEEGGRFYHEQNRNVILEIHKEELGSLPEGYVWMELSALMQLVQINNCLNIQLRNLLSLIEI